MSTVRYWVFHCIALLLIACAFITPRIVDSTVLEWLGVPHTAESIAISFFLLYYGTQAALIVFFLLHVFARWIERRHGSSGLSAGVERSFVWLGERAGKSLLRGFFYVVGGVWLYFIVIVFNLVFRFISISELLDFVGERFGSTVGYGFAALLFMDMARHGQWSEWWLTTILGDIRKNKQNE